MIRKYISLLRPHQWIKNSFVFLPLFFGQQLQDSSLWLPVIMAFLSFCLAASGIYCLNDICDVESDKQHTKKRHRPIASGAISIFSGYLTLAICWCFALLFAYLAGNGDTWIEISSVSIVSVYILMNVAYCLWLKHFSIIDVFIIAAGFVFRIFLGGSVTRIELSQWIVLMTFLLALFIAIAKRRDDVVAYEMRGIKLRGNIARYNLAFMNQALSIVASITMVCYVMYTVSEDVVARVGSHYLYMTSVFVLAGIIRFLQVALVDIRSGSPTKVLLKDRFIQACILGWVLSFCVLLYF